MIDIGYIFNMRRNEYLVKRVLDLLLVIIFFVPVTIVILVSAIIIIIDTNESPIFSQERIGKRQKVFKLIKLRTMHSGTEQKPSHEISRSSITRIGELLRKTKIDELPQLWSVLVGDMSFVGPRPCLPSQHELIAERACRGVFAARPGITGLGQLAGVDMSTPRLLAEIDARYVASATIMGDMRIIVRTAIGGGRGDAAG